MPSFIHMESQATGHVDITLNLSPYINAYEKAHSPSVGDRHNHSIANTEFNQLKNDMHEQLDGISGQMHWINALSLAIQDLEKTQQATIEASPAANMMENSFIEIIKNSMDEAVSNYYDHNQEPVITLSLDIEHTRKPNLISIQITDSGHGFPQSFLEKVGSPEARATYVNASRGSNRAQHNDRPPLFGGQGRGLRILIADENGDVLEHAKRIHRFTKPDVSIVKFSNAVDNNANIRGAQITVETSITPREELVHIFSKMKEGFHDEVIKDPTDSQATTQNSSPLTVGASPLTIDLNFMDENEKNEGEENDWDDDDFSSPKC